MPYWFVEVHGAQARRGLLVFACVNQRNRRQEMWDVFWSQIQLQLRHLAASELSTSKARKVAAFRVSSVPVAIVPHRAVGSLSLDHQFAAIEKREYSSREPV
jgi:hypothetical protein